MPQIQFRILQPGDHTAFQLVADWYLEEWKIPAEKTVQRLQTLTADASQFQVLMTVDNLPVATGGLYHHVGLLDKEPRFKMYRNWLALVYTTPGQRQKGYGAMICNYIQDHSKSTGIDKMYLFTDTAESLYKKLGWTELERVAMGGRNVVIMTKDL